MGDSPEDEDNLKYQVSCLKKKKCVSLICLPFLPPSFPPFLLSFFLFFIAHRTISVCNHRTFIYGVFGFISVFLRRLQSPLGLRVNLFLFTNASTVGTLNKYTQINKWQMKFHFINILCYLVVNLCPWRNTI